MSLLDDDERVVPLNKGASPRQEAEVLTRPEQVVLDIRKDVQKFKDGGPRKELVEALRDQFVATRHQAVNRRRTLTLPRSWSKYLAQFLNLPFSWNPIGVQG